MNRYALIIGLDTHKNILIPPLKYAVADAEDLAAVLGFEGDHQFPSENLIILRNKDATQEAVLHELRSLAAKVREDDLAIFFYAGHGCSEQGKDGDRDDKLRKFLIPWDTDIKDLDGSALDFDSLAKTLGKVKSNRFIQIFDCCYSGAIGGRTFQVPGVRQTPSLVGREYLQKVSGQGRVVMTACTGQEVAKELPDFGHGIFSHFIIEGLRGRADFKQDGVVDLEELWMFAQDETTRGTNHAQNPVREGWIQGGAIHLSRSKVVEGSEKARGDLRERILEKYGSCRLQEVVIAEGDDTESLSAAAAHYLDQYCLRSNQKIAVSCGSTLIATIGQLPRQKHRGVQIFPLNGSPSDEVRLTDSMVLTYLLWSKFEADRARAHVVPTGVPEDLFQQVEQGIASLAEKVLEQAREADVFLFGIGSPTRNKNIPYLLEKASLGPEDLVSMGAVGEINFHIYDDDGVLLTLHPELNEAQSRLIRDYNSKFFSLAATDLVEISRRSGVELVVVAGGEVKRLAIRAAIRGGFVRTLVTDLETADWLSNVAPP